MKEIGDNIITNFKIKSFNKQLRIFRKNLLKVMTSLIGWY